jgi:hypothetical protein
MSQIAKNSEKFWRSPSQLAAIPNDRALEADNNKIGSEALER